MLVYRGWPIAPAAGSGYNLLAWLTRAPRGQSYRERAPKRECHRKSTPTINAKSKSGRLVAPSHFPAHFLRALSTCAAGLLAAACLPNHPTEIPPPTSPSAPPLRQSIPRLGADSTSTLGRLLRRPRADATASPAQPWRQPPHRRPGRPQRRHSPRPQRHRPPLSRGWPSPGLPATTGLRCAARFKLCSTGWAGWAMCSAAGTGSPSRST